MIEDNDPAPANTQPGKSEMSETEIDKNLQDTFPASDPPSWTLGTNHREEPSVEDASDKDNPPRH